MIQSENYLTEMGLKWKGNGGDETLYEVFNDPDSFSHMNNPSEMEKIFELFLEYGYLIIEDKDLLAKKLGCEEQVGDAPQELMDCLWISFIDRYLIGGENEEIVTINEDSQRLEDFFDSAEGEHIKEKYVKGYELKRIFNKKEAEEEAWEKMGLSFNRASGAIEEKMNENIKEIMDGLVKYCCSDTSDI